MLTRITMSWQHRLILTASNGGRMDFDVLGTKITSCVWDGDLVIKGTRSYDRPEITFFNADLVDGILDVDGKSILCIEKIEDGLYQIRYQDEDEIYQIQYKDEKEVTILHAERYERIINN